MRKQMIGVLAVAVWMMIGSMAAAQCGLPTAAYAPVVTSYYAPAYTSYYAPAYTAYVPVYTAPVYTSYYAPPAVTYYSPVTSGCSTWRRGRDLLFPRGPTGCLLSRLFAVRRRLEYLRRSPRVRARGAGAQRPEGADLVAGHG